MAAVFRLKAPAFQQIFSQLLFAMKQLGQSSLNSGATLSAPMTAYASSATTNVEPWRNASHLNPKTPMSDSIPNSPSEFFANLPPEKQLLSTLETDAQYIKQFQEHISDAKDDEIFEIKIGELRSMLICWLAVNESLDNSFRGIIKIRKFINRFRR